MNPGPILIIDDDVDALKLVGLMLERQGYQIVAATNGRQAIEKALEVQPILIILDVMMPDMDGYQVASRLRSHPATAPIPILMFTAKTAVSDKIAGFQAGADDYLIKPVHPRELLARVEALLQRRDTVGASLETGTAIAFLPTKGGLGTSTMALNTAVELTRMQEDRKSIVIELQEGRGTLAQQLGVSNTVDEHRRLPELLAKPLSHLTTERLRNYVVRHNSGLHALLTTAQPVGSGSPLKRQHVRTLLHYLATEYEYLLLDLPSRLDAGRQEALRLSRLILMAVEPTPIGMDLAQNMLKALEASEVGRQKVRLVLMHRAPAPGTISRNMVEEALHCEMIAGMPPAPDLAYRSGENGKPMVEIEPHSLVAQQARRIVQAILAV